MNILAPEVLRKIRSSLSRGWVCGLHQYLGGGRSGDAVAFSTYTDFISRIEKARSGDLFILWSVDDLRRQDLILAHGNFPPRAAGEGIIEPREMQQVVDYLGQHHEVLAAASYGNGELEALVTDEDFPEKIQNMAVRAAVPGGEMWVLPFTSIDGEKYYLAYAKKPNAAGEVPSGGAY